MIWMWRVLKTPPVFGVTVVVSVVVVVVCDCRYHRCLFPEDIHVQVSEKKKNSAVESTPCDGINATTECSDSHMKMHGNSPFAVV